jgi:hypothetical protein
MTTPTTCPPRKWLRRTLIAMAALTLILGMLYEASTHVVRGWLRGEAFFEGRPTSYWRPRCDEWLERFDDDYSFQMMTWLIPFEYAEAPGIRKLGLPKLDHEGQNWVWSNPKQTHWTRFRDSLRPKADLDKEAQFDFAPKILWGTADTQPVLEELAAEEKYRPLAKIALGRVEKIKGVYAQFLKEQAAAR